MRLMRTALASSLALGLLLAAACAPANSGDASGIPLGQVTDFRLTASAPLEKGLPPPNLQFTMPDGETVFLSDLKGKVVLLNFWATTCPYCVIEMPYLQQAHEELASRGVVILGINTGEDEKLVRAFVMKKKLTFPIIMDPDVYMSFVYGARYLPTTYVIDKAGNVQVGKVGAFENAEDLITMLKTFVE